MQKVDVGSPVKYYLGGTNSAAMVTYVYEDCQHVDLIYWNDSNWYPMIYICYRDNDHGWVFPGEKL